MRRLICTGLCLLSAIVAPRGVDAQVAPMGPPAAQPPVFDWRFDAQYNSTVKPHLRWYRRGLPPQPKTEPQVIYFMAPEMGGDCGCGGSGYGTAPVVPPQRPSWFNPWKYLERGAKLPPLSTTPMRSLDVATAPSETVNGWVHRDEKPGSKSVLFVKPDASIADQFVAARVTMQKGRVVSVHRPYDRPAPAASMLAADRRMPTADEGR